jgi:enolase
MENNKMLVTSVHYRRILNSHGEFTNEFIIFLNNGSIGRGASPKGETISIYEDKHIDISPKKIIDILKKDRVFFKPLNQEDLDSYLEEKIGLFGRNNSYALSLAFYDANEHFMQTFTIENRTIQNNHIPKLCINILNGGNHAYTNPVQSEFSEFLLVAKTDNLLSFLNDHELIQSRVKDKLRKLDIIYINKNLVYKSDHNDNRDWFDLLQTTLKELGLEKNYDLMIDASASDLWTGQEYRFSITNNFSMTKEEMCTYWFDLIKDYNLKILEDPFHETDFESWHNLTNNQFKCKIVGDNLYSGDHKRIAQGIDKKYTHGIILKPNQAGTVSNTIKSINLVQQHNHLLIVSHRSISTESTFLAHISNKYNAEYIKNGPILTDYSSIIRLNEFIRLTGLGYE